MCALARVCITLLTMSVLIKTVVLVPKLASLTSAKIIEAQSASADPIVLRFFTAHHLGVFPECPNVQLSTDLRAVRIQQSCALWPRHEEKRHVRQLNISFCVCIVCQTSTAV